MICAKDPESITRGGDCRFNCKLKSTPTDISGAMLALVRQAETCF